MEHNSKKVFVSFENNGGQRLIDLLLKQEDSQWELNLDEENIF